MNRIRGGMMNKIKIGALNCQGIKEKFETPEFLEIVQSCLVFGVCETWLKKGENTINPLWGDL